MFKDRYDAARQLVVFLEAYNNDSDTVILAIPRGGLELGYVLSRELNLILDVIFIKKIGYPGNSEYAIGAVSMDHVYISPEFMHEPWIKDYVEQQTIEIRQLLHERALLYRGGKPIVEITDKTVIIVDDGVATGHTLFASLELIKKEGPKKIILALPVASQKAIDILSKQVDEIVCLKIPDNFFGVAQFYQKFEQVDDQEAIRLLHEADKIM